MLTNIMLIVLWIAFAVVLIILVAFGWCFNIILAIWLMGGALLRTVARAWKVLKEEVCRPVRVIRKALSRKELVELDDFERHLS